MSKLIIYGDIHGCYSEFISLRNKINPRFDDVEVCVGDILTKGKYSVKTLDFIIKHNIKSALGNHEEKLLRYIKHQKSLKKNPVQLTLDEDNIIASLTDEHIKFLESMPLFLRFGSILILHGGLQNKLNLDNLTKRDKEKILRLRYIDQDEHFIAYGDEQDDSIFWADVYDGNQGFVIYGHQWFEEVKKSPFALGIDTGCVYGNKLSAVIFNDPINVQQYQIFDAAAKEFRYEKTIKRSAELGS